PPPRPPRRHPRARQPDRSCLAPALGVTDAVHAAALLAPWAFHRSHESSEVPFLFVEEGGVAGVHPERRHERVLVRERVPAERREVEEEALWWDARLLSCRRERGETLLHGAAEEFGDAASIFERLALDEADEVPVVAEKVEKGADVRLDGVLGRAVLVLFG